jgi:hypothetical protein
MTHSTSPPPLPPAPVAAQARVAKQLVSGVTTQWYTGRASNLNLYITFENLRGLVFTVVTLIFLRTFLTAEVFLNPSGFLGHIQLTHSVGLLWTSDQPVAEASTYTGQHNIETQETNINSNPRPQQPSGRRLTP